MKSKINGCTHHETKVLKMKDGGKVPSGEYRAKQYYDGVNHYVRDGVTEADMDKYTQMLMKQGNKKAALQMAGATGRENAARFIKGLEKRTMMRNRTGGD